MGIYDYKSDIDELVDYIGDRMAVVTDATEQAYLQRAWALASSLYRQHEGTMEPTYGATTQRLTGWMNWEAGNDAEWGQLNYSDDQESSVQDSIKAGFYAWTGENEGPLTYKRPVADQTPSLYLGSKAHYDVVTGMVEHHIADASTNVYSYGSRNITYVPVKNTSNSAVEIDVKGVLSSYSTYTYANIFMATPNNSTGSTSSWTFNRASDYQTSNAYAATVTGSNVSIPANRTVILMWVSCDQYRADLTGSYQFINNHTLEEMYKGIFSRSGIECDMNVLHTMHCKDHNGTWNDLMNVASSKNITQWPTYY